MPSAGVDPTTQEAVEKITAAVPALDEDNVDDQNAATNVYFGIKVPARIASELDKVFPASAVAAWRSNPGAASLLAQWLAVHETKSPLPASTLLALL